MSCTQSGGNATWGTNPCQPVYCPAGSSSDASWPQTLGGQSGAYTCLPGYFASTSSVYCTQNGGSASWGLNPCQPVYCLAGSSSNATWPQTLSGTSGIFICTNGYFASNPSVYCNQTGGSATWGLNPCQVACPSETSSNTAWPQTLAGTTATGKCSTGYSGSLTRDCLSNGSWSTTSTGTACTGKGKREKAKTFLLRFVALTGHFLRIFFFPSLAVSSNTSLVGEIVGPIVGVLCFLALVIVVAIFLRRRKQEKRRLEAFAMADTESQNFDSGGARSTVVTLPRVSDLFAFFRFVFVFHCNPSDLFLLISLRQRGLFLRTQL